MSYWEYLAVLSSQIWDFCPADVSSCVTGVELCVGYDDVETQRIVWAEAKHCCLLLTMGQIWTHTSKGSKASTLAFPGKYRLQNNKSFSKENPVIFVHHIITTWAHSLLKVERCLICQFFKTQVPFADWGKYVPVRQYAKNTVHVKSTIERPGKASSIYREDEKKKKSGQMVSYFFWGFPLCWCGWELEVLS